MPDDWTCTPPLREPADAHIWARCHCGSEFEGRGVEAQRRFELWVIDHQRCAGDPGAFASDTPVSDTERHDAGEK